jgi:hypothetical protein
MDSCNHQWHDVMSTTLQSFLSKSSPKTTTTTETTPRLTTRGRYLFEALARVHHRGEESGVPSVTCAYCDASYWHYTYPYPKRQCNIGRAWIPFRLSDTITQAASVAAISTSSVSDYSMNNKHEADVLSCRLGNQLWALAGQEAPSESVVQSLIQRGADVNATHCRCSPPMIVIHHH